MPKENRAVVGALLEIMATSFRDDPATFTQATNQLEAETGVAGVARLVTIGAATAERHTPESPASSRPGVQLSPTQKLAVGALLGLGVGYMVRSL